MEWCGRDVSEILTASIAPNGVHESDWSDRAPPSAFGRSRIPSDGCRHSAERAARALARVIDRARVLEQQLDVPVVRHPAAIEAELNVLERRARLIYHAIKLSTLSALLVCFLLAMLFASSMLHHSTRLIINGLFIAAMLASIVSLALFLREVYFEIETFEIALPAGTRRRASHASSTASAGRLFAKDSS
jgi:Protein of unknown function (DUF2721)